MLMGGTSRLRDSTLFPLVLRRDSQGARFRRIMMMMRMDWFCQGPNLGERTTDQTCRAGWPGVTRSPLARSMLGTRQSRQWARAVPKFPMSYRSTTEGHGGGDGPL